MLFIIREILMITIKCINQRPNPHPKIDYIP